MEMRRLLTLLITSIMFERVLNFFATITTRKKIFWHWGRSYYFTFYTNDESSKPGNMLLYITSKKRGASPTVIMHWSPTTTTIGINWLVLKTLPTDPKKALPATKEVSTIMRTRFNKKKNQNRNFFVCLIKHWTGVFLLKEEKA